MQFTCISIHHLLERASLAAALPSGKRRGTIFIVGFRSRGSFGKKDRRQRSHEGENRVPHAARESGHVGPSNSSSDFLFRGSLALTSSSFQILSPVNFQVIWTLFGSLKLKSIENRVFCQCRVNSRKIGKLWDLTQIIIKQWYNPYMMQIWLKYENYNAKFMYAI